MKQQYSNPTKVILCIFVSVFVTIGNLSAQISGPDDEYRPPVYSDEDLAKILGVAAATGGSDDTRDPNAIEPNTGLPYHVIEKARARGLLPYRGSQDSSDNRNHSQTQRGVSSPNAGEPDHSDETMAKLRPLLPKAEAAYDRGDYSEAFEIYLTMWEGCHIPIVRSSVLTAAWKCIDQTAVEAGRHQSNSVYAILNKCPEPSFTENGYDDASYALENSIYGFAQYVLAQRSNINHDFESAGMYLARAEIYFERAHEIHSDPAEIARLRELISQGKAILQRNGQIEQYYAALNAARSVFSGRSEGGSSTHTKSETELDRFKAHWRGRTANFIVTSDNGGTAQDGTTLVVRDGNTGKKFKVHYNVGFSRGLFDDNESAVGRSVSIRFGDDGFPNSIKNLENGRGTQTSTGGKWVVEGFGW